MPPLVDLVNTFNFGLKGGAPCPSLTVLGGGSRWPTFDLWSESEGLSSSDVREHNVESFAFHIVGENKSGRKGVSFPGGLATCDGWL